MPNINKNEELSLDDSVKVNKQGNPILGRLVGPCADFLDSTRNGRKYDESLWDKVFDDPIVKEYFECGGIPGELDHPTDRTETCSEKIAVMMPEPPKKNDNGELIASFDILDTPNGRITYTLAKYGYKLGISSRGSGDTYTDMDGEEHVDEDSYDFQAFDVVLLPAVKKARLELIDESFNRESVGFKKAINEALEKSNDNDKKIMKETLENLKIDYLPEKVNNTKSENSVEAAFSGTEMVSDLQEALLKNQKLEKQIKKLQEQISVSYTKEKEFAELKEKFNNTNKQFSENEKTIKALKTRISKLVENLKEIESKKISAEEELKRLRESYSEKSSNSSNDKKLLQEKLQRRDREVQTLKKEIGKLNSSINDLTEKNNKFIEDKNVLEEKLEDAKKDASIKYSEYSSKLSKERSLTEKYKKIAKRAVEKYIGVQATIIGVRPSEIENKLSENYSFDDIDRVCEDLKEYKLNISKLPFSTSNGKYKMTVKESYEPIIPNEGKVDDSVDSSLLGLAGML